MNTDELNSLIVYSVRYALGRMSYAVSDVVDIAINHREELNITTIKILRREIYEATSNNNAGMACDRANWERLLKVLEK